MRLHRFHIASNINKDTLNTFSSASLAHQLRSVFRFHEGSRLVFFDGSGNDYVSEIVSLGKQDVTFRVDETRSVKRRSSIELTLAISLVKKDNVEWVIEKGTELGVSRFAPLLSERSEKKGFNVERAQRIIVEAAEQSGRSELPTLGDVLSLEDAIAALRGTVVAFHTDGPAFSKSALPAEGEISILIGPEGGWSPKEIELFKEKGIPTMKFDSPVMRAETAAIASAAAILLS